MSITFFPEDYKEPKKANNYMQLLEGENRIRILSKPIVGYEDWKDKKPVRFTIDNEPKKSFDSKRPYKLFIAFIVFNYKEEKIQILHVTQASIRVKIKNLCDDKDWGAPYFYDIKIMKSGEGMETKYAVNPVPHKPIDPYMIQCFNELPCNLEAIFANTDPFAVDQKVYTKLAIHDDSKSFNGIDPKEIEQLKEMLEDCDPVYKEQILTTFKNPETIPLDLFDRIKKSVQNKRDAYQNISKNNLTELAMA